MLGFHSNEFGTFLAIAYGLSLGVWNSAESGREKKRLGAIVVGTGIALLLTFSRGAYLAFAVTNVVVFMGSSPKKRAAFLLVTLLLALAAPAPLVDRAGYGLTTRDANEISAGRVDNLWVPLLPNIADHVWVGQGLQSIMWTEAQLFQQIYPVNSRAQCVPGSPARPRRPRRDPRAGVVRLPLAGFVPRCQEPIPTRSSGRSSSAVTWPCSRSFCAPSRTTG